ncbi:MAG: Glycogen phosphorylase [Pelotomaculum sp. PtaU1.Bin035]|nr:MAG: Glycogen phosphorylase [Pelotomaculum sp. PtaU1.Bin035]
MLFANAGEFREAYIQKFSAVIGKGMEEGIAWDYYKTLVYLLKDKLNVGWARTNKQYKYERKQVYYFSMEFLIGKLLAYYLMNLGLTELVTEGLGELGINLQDLIDEERDAGLGNGGLGRLAACFLDSMAYLQIPGHGNGIRYKYGLFEQKIEQGFQVEVPDHWLKNGYPWEIRKPDKAIIVKFKGHLRVEYKRDRMIFYHENYEPVLAVPYDIPIVVYGNSPNVNTLRLWSAETVNEEFDLASFNRGEFTKALSNKSEIEAISYILYPQDTTLAGQELRLKQEYFFVAAGLGAIVRRYKKQGEPIEYFSQKVAVHINDTHPAMCVPELMRLLMDEEGLAWDDAWNITVNTLSYTNHTLLPEALEKWPIDLMKCTLPRIYLIVEEINRRFEEMLEFQYPGEQRLKNNTVILRDGYVHMANLAVIGCHSVNGVAKLHTEIVKSQVFQGFNVIYPDKFNNKTNGVSHRRFLLHANPLLAGLITEAIGPKWIEDPGELHKLLELQNDTIFLHYLRKAKKQNKTNFAGAVKVRFGLELDPSSIFDIQVKRFHAYKRQLLNVLKIMDLYNCLKEQPQSATFPQTFVFAGKAAPGYYYAKTVIKLINTLAQKINNDPEVNQLIKVVFLENFNVTLAEEIYPVADISEQISTASKEASGTGNMKFMMNGAITLGTLDGATVEIRDAVGAENIYIFGLKAEQVIDYQNRGAYNSREEYQANPRLKRVVDQLINNFFKDCGNEFRILYDSLLTHNDEFFILKDFNSYVETAAKITGTYLDELVWQKMVTANIAQSGIFSSDRTIREYAGAIWQI